MRHPPSLLCLAALLLPHPAAGLSLHARRPARTRTTCPTAAATSAPLHAFDQWLSSNGVSHPHVEAKPLPGFGMSLVAAADGVRAGATLLSVPASLHLSPRSVRESAVGRAVGGVISDESALLALGLLHEAARGAESKYGPYLAMLPSIEEMQVPLLWAEEERAQLLAGSHLLTIVESTLLELRTQWDALERTAFREAAHLFPRETFRFERYLWAHAVVLTRALPFGDSLSLIPLLDFANHAAGANNTCSIAMRTADGGVEPLVEAAQLQRGGGEAAAVVTAGAALAPGEQEGRPASAAAHELAPTRHSSSQVFIDYGEAGWRSSWEMLYTYGFVPGDGDAWLAAGGRPIFFEGFSRDDPLAAQKAAVLVALGADEAAAEGTWVELKALGRGGEMAPFLRLVELADDGATPHAAALAAWEAEPRALWAALQLPLGAAAEARVAARVRAECEAALRALPAAEELKDAAAPPAGGGESGERVRRRLAARVLLGERCALEGCLAHWERAARAAAAA
ncbi:hypothetical protein AB1Y20_004208 [Prymnesium parvum]|uniref:Rubisco LSMT substrate-binding domain-containing protein n=1 Tax=Prymnesium parvum TaxID=97485 RepID=A0AB34J9T6_PRYPA